MSLGGLDIPLLKITDYADTEVPLFQRLSVIITGNLFLFNHYDFLYRKGRVHPGETNSSWIMQVRSLSSLTYFKINH